MNSSLSHKIVELVIFSNVDMLIDMLIYFKF